MSCTYLRRPDRYVVEVVPSAEHGSDSKHEFGHIKWTYIHAKKAGFHYQDVFDPTLTESNWTLGQYLLTLHEGLITIIVKNGLFVKSVAGDLSARGFPTCSIHGEKSDSDKDEALQAFQPERLPILVIEESLSYMIFGLNTPRVQHVIFYGTTAGRHIKLAKQAEEKRRAKQRQKAQRQLDKQEEEKRRAAWGRYNAATTIFCWWRRRQLDNHFKKMKEESIAATTIFCWWRRMQLKGYFGKHRAARIIQCWNRQCLFRIHRKASQAATTIQRWRQSIITRRKQLKLDAAASSSALRERGQPLPPINHRQRYRRNQRARRQRNSKRSRPSRKRGQPRGRPPNSTQPQQSQQQSIKRRENVLGIALSNSGRSSIRGSVIGSVHNNRGELKTAGPYVLGRDLRRRDSDGRVTALGTALQSSGLSSKESVIGTTLQGNESSSRGNTTEKPQQDSSESHRSSTQPISSLKSTSSRRRRRRRRRRKHPRTNHHRKDGASTSTRHTPTYPSNNAHLSNISDFCDGIRRQLQQASSSDRNLLKFVCQLVLQTIDNQPTEPSIIDKIESTSTPPSVSNNPSSTINNELFSSINIVDSHTPKSTITTKLTELPCSVSITTEETTTRHEKPNTYLQALVGTTSNFG